MSQESPGKPGRLFYLISAGALFIWGLCAYWFWGTGPALETESPLRIVFGAVMVFLMPGLTWGEVLGLRSRHFLTTIALATALSLAIGITLCPLSFLFHHGIRLWSALILVVSGTGLILAAVKASRGRGFTFLAPFAEQIDFRRSEHLFALAFLLTLVLMSFAAYRWGEDLLDISREKLLHLHFVRFYYALPHVFDDIGILPGLTPPNQVHFWEYLLAGWSALVKMDPLPVFFRCRFVIPALGLSGMYLLVYAIFVNRRHVDVLFTIILVMALGELMLLPPSALDWVKADPTRGVMAFMGTAHHADSAMDLALPLLMGVGLLGLRTRGMKLPIIFTGLLAAVFAWHPREFFQLAVYLTILGGVSLITVRKKLGTLLRRWGGVLCLFFLVAGLFALLMTINGFSVNKPSSYPELAIKQKALQYAFQAENLLTVRSPLNFPFHFTLSSSRDPGVLIDDQVLSNTKKKSWPPIFWMVLTGLSLPVLSLLGGLRSRQLALFTILIWFLLFAWNSGMLVFLMLTFSELFVTTPRNIYILSYIVIAEAIFLVSGIVTGKTLKLKNLSWLLLLFLFGCVLDIWWQIRIPSYQFASTILGILLVGSLIFIVLSRFLKIQFRPAAYSSLASIAGCFLFFSPIFITQYHQIVPRIFIEHKPSIDWFGSGNPFGLSGEIIAAFRSLPPKNRILVNPFEFSPVSIYTPQYVVPSPVGTVIEFNRLREEIYNNQHPLIKNPKATLSFLPPLLNEHSPLIHTSFQRWPAPMVIKGNILPDFFPPVWTRRDVDQFEIVHFIEDGAGAIRLRPLAPSGRGRENSIKAIDLLYEPGKNGLESFSGCGQFVTFLVRCRTSENLFYQPILFIEDWRPDKTRDIVGVRIGTTRWDDYVIIKPLREGADEIRMVLEWRAVPGEWLEVEKLAVYITNEHPLIDHHQVIQWLSGAKIDYLFFLGESYQATHSYLKAHSDFYNFLTDLHKEKQLMVRFNQEKS